MGVVIPQVTIIWSKINQMVPQESHHKLKALVIVM